tara:strand:+ start:389 stop:751 length:363 start_codon:yes stop_codon:yes gene_type:complete
MSWKTLSKIDIRNRDGESENFEIQHDGNYYRIQNEFGNISFEFDVSSGYTLSEELSSIIKNDVEDEINSFLNEQDVAKDSKGLQVDLFDRYKKYSKSFKTKNNLKITLDGTNNIKLNSKG